MTDQQRDAARDFIEGIGLLRSAFNKLKEALAILLQMPEFVEVLAQGIPGAGRLLGLSGHERTGIGSKSLSASIGARGVDLAERSQRPTRPPMASLEQVRDAANGLAEALSILCDNREPEFERRETLGETWWYLDWFHASKITVELREASGEVVVLQREVVPSQVVDYICLHATHATPGRMNPGRQLWKDIEALEESRTPLGPALLVLPVHEGVSFWGRNMPRIWPAGGVTARRAGLHARPRGGAKPRS